MKPETWKKVEEWYQAALEIPSRDRTAFLERVCPDDAGLRSEVQSLLDQDADSFLESAALPVAPTLAAGVRMGNFEIVELLGRGGMGEVYRARDLRLGREVAIKTLPPSLAGDPSRVARFEREARAASALNHPNIVTVHDVGHDGRVSFIVAELVDGETLARWIERGPVPWPRLAEIAKQICAGLAAAHAAGVVHRDLKPANIMLTRDGRVKILDFGLARQGRLLPTDSSRGISHAGFILGTPGYMSPEQVRSQPVDARSDLFSLGLILHEMATGKPAFQGRSSIELMNSILNDDPPELPPASPLSLDRIVRRCLEKDPARRFQSAADLGFAFESVQEQISGEAPEAGETLVSRPASRSKAHPPARRPYRWALLTGAALALLGLAEGVRLLYSHRTRPLTDADTIVLADFANSTGDSVFDDTLKQATAAALQQSPFWKILPDRNVSETLKLMGLSPAARLDARTALDLCQRTESQAVLAGSIASFGSQYVIGLNAVNCQTGASIARESAQAATKEKILDVLNRSVMNLRQKLGESLGSVERFDTHLDRATTPSLEALQAYTKGRRTMLAGNDPQAAVPLFDQAIQADPQFAMAYLSRGLSYGGLGDSGQFISNIQKAYDLRERTSQWERLAIEERYFNSVVGDLPRARKTTVDWVQTYPRDALPLEVLGEIDTKLGRHEEALADLSASAKLDSANNRVNLILSYLYSNRLDEARAAVEGELRKVDTPDMHSCLYRIAVVQEDMDGIARQSAWFASTPGMEERLHMLECERAVQSGELRRTREIVRRLLALAGDHDELRVSAYLAEAALREAVFGYPAEARRLASASRRFSGDIYTEGVVALALAFAGDATPARAIEKDLIKRFANNTLVRFHLLSAVEGQLMLGSGSRNFDEAIDALSAATPYDLASVPTPLESDAVGAVDLYPAYVRGQAYLAAHRGPEAAAEFEKILRHPMLTLGEPISPLAQLGLARAYVLQSDVATARSAYRKFLASWKAADADIPGLKEARAEYQRIQ